MLAPPADLALERLRRLPQHADDVFELGVIRMPSWIVGGPDEPYRPLLLLARSRRLGMVADGQMVKPSDLAQMNPLEAVAKLAAHRGVGYRPAGIVVRDPALAEALKDRLAPLGVTVELAAALPLIDLVAADMASNLSGGPRLKGYIDQPGVTLAHVRAFAEASTVFHHAALWNHLADYDLVRVESPRPAREFSCFVVMGAGGREFGLAFFASAADHGALSGAEGPDDAVLWRPRWSLTFDAPHDLPVADSDLWLDHALPVAAPHAHPFMCRMVRGDEPERPDAAQLAFAGGLMRALAATTEDDLDSGRWKKNVIAYDGEREFVLALPGVLKPRPARGGMPDRRLMERTLADLQVAVERQALSGAGAINDYIATLGGRVPHAPATTPRERAAEKYHQALGAQGRNRIKLAREAIALWPDYADAWVLRAEDMPDLQRARELWQQALDAATRELGPEAFREHLGRFWGVLETRPYMRARAGLAGVQWALDQQDAGIEHWHEMLSLDSHDHLGVRLILAPRLLTMGRDAAAERVLEQFADDPATMLEFSRALLAFRREGAGPRAAAALARSLKANRHVFKHLLGSPTLEREERGGHYSPGDEREAAIVMHELGVAFEHTPGAQAWLRDHRREGKRARKQGLDRR